MIMIICPSRAIDVGHLMTGSVVSRGSGAIYDASY